MTHMLVAAGIGLFGLAFGLVGHYILTRAFD